MEIITKNPIKLSDPVPRVVAAAGTDLTQGVARLTFSASKRTTMGFAEPDKTEETKEKSEKTVKEKGSDNNINKETPEKAANIVTETPKKDVTDVASSKSVTR